MLGSGTIAVYTFFAMSGHVVAYRYLQDGTAESLLSAVFRRVPRLVLPALWANLISWMLAVHGAYSSEEEWRYLRNLRLSTDDHWCKDCMSTDLGSVVRSSLQVMWTFKTDHFLWLWTLPQEICGSAMVFMLAPLARFVVNSGLAFRGMGEHVSVGDHSCPRHILRCLSFHGVLTATLLVLGCLESHCSDLTGTMAPGAWCERSFVVALRWSGLDRVWMTLALFEFGLASAHMRVLLTAPSACGSSWEKAAVSKWTDEWKTKWCVPAFLVIIGLGATTVPGNNVIHIAPALAVRNTGVDMYMLGAFAVFLGVLVSPREVRDQLANLSMLGQMSFSMYLLHMSVIWCVGMPLYNWIDHGLSPGVAFFFIAAACFGPILVVSHIFWMAIEDPLGVRLPRFAFDGIQWLIFDSRKPRPPVQATISLNDALSRASDALAGADA